MPAPQRPIAYVLAATNHGSMIVNRNDHHAVRPDAAYGVGFQLLQRSSFDPSEVELVLQLLSLRRELHGDGLVAIDGGANIGVHTIEWGRHMHGWGRALAFEAQEFVFYALAGNIALNNCFNASARWMALGAAPGEILVPRPDYHRPASFGSLELRPATGNEFIGQPISYAASDCVRTPMTSIDTLALERLDFLKLDVEGMELEVLRGARATLQRHKPMLLVEILKSDQAALVGFMQDLGYEVHALGLNALAVHRDDPCRQRVQFAPPPAQPS